MKKALSIILAIVMLFGCMSITAFAAEDDCKTCEGTGKAAPAEEQKEILPFSQYNVVFDETDNMNHYYYEGTNFTITGSSLVDERGVVAGNKWYPLTVKSNDPAVIITRVEAVVSYFGEDYDLVGIDKGEKMELDEVENGTTVHINNIDSDSFSFVGGEGTASFSNITVYYVGTPNTCEHSFTGEYLNNGDTHLRKCAYCDVYGAEESHTFVKHKCVCGALETVQKSELLPFNMNNINDDNTYTYVGDDFTLYNSPAPFGYGMNVGGTSQLTITSNDPSLVINRIEAVVYMAGTHYNTIIPSSGVKLEKGGVANGTTVHINNIDASTFSFTGLGDNGCKMTDITVYYTNGELIHKYNGEYKDNGTTHSPKCTECDEYGQEEVHDFSGDYKNNGETHSQKCTVCGVYGPDVQHIYENGVCACGAEDPSEFVITEDGTLIKYNGLGGDIILPAGILAINDGVFEGNNTITSVEFPYYDGENVRALGANAFKDCKNLTKVVLPETINRIGANAFAGCESLSNITISNTVSARFLGNGAFDANYLKTVSFPCYLDEDTMADMMGRYGDFTYKQLDHNYVNHECTICGAISDHDFTGDYVDNGDGTHSRKCVECGKYGTSETHSFTDGKCICGANVFEFVSKNLALDSAFAFKFYGYLNDKNPADDAYMEFKIGNNRTVNIALKDATKDNDGRYVFICYLNVLELDEKIEAIFHDGEITVERENPLSVTDYLDCVLERHQSGTDEDVKTVNLINAISNYAHYAQLALDETHTEYEVGNGGKYVGTDARTAITLHTAEELKAFEAVKTVADGFTAVKSTSRSLVLDDETAIVVYITPANAEYIPNVKVTDKNGNDVNFTCDKQENGKYKVVIRGIAAHKLSDTYTVDIDNGSLTYTDLSALSYAYSILSSGKSEAYKMAVSALYDYYTATVAYMN